jgi:DNA-binding MarR family transcriptional regulator
MITRSASLALVSGVFMKLNPGMGTDVPKRVSRRELLAEVNAEGSRQGGAAVRLNIAIAHQQGMPLTDLQCMGLLAEMPSTPSDLAARLGLTTGAMTKVLDRLERSGYVARSADPADRRRITISADSARLADLAEAYAPMGERISRHLAGYSTAELEAVLKFMRFGQQAADEEIAEIRGRGIRHATRRRRGGQAPGRTAADQGPA